MQVPLLDLSQQYHSLGDELRREINSVLDSQVFILGPKVEEFERAVAAYCGIPHAIGVSSGTDALLAVLMALEFGPGDAVLTSAYTFFATAGCVARVGATPVFIDIDPSTYNISSAALARYLREKCHRNRAGNVVNDRGQNVRAIVPVHLFGLCCEMETIRHLGEEFDLMVIEDAAQAIGAECRFVGETRKAGTIGAVGCFSFYPSKNLGAAGDAGLIVCRDDALAQKLRVCRQHGMEPRYFHHFVGGNFRLDELQAAVLKVKLPHLDAWSAARRAAANRYRQEFERRGLTSHLTLPTEPYRGLGLTNHHIYHQYVIRTTRRDALQAHLKGKQIGTAIYYPLGLHEQACFAQLGYQKGDLPETERAATETLALPIYPEITLEQQRYVVDSIAEFFG